MPETTPPTDTRTLEEAKQWLRERFEQGAECPCCKQYVKLYKRKLNSFMAYALLLIDRYFRQPDAKEWLHVPSYLVEQNATDRECAKLRYWGLIEEMPEGRDDGSPHAGFYKITELGKQFVARKIRVPMYIHLYNGGIVKRKDEETIDIYEALGEKFNYNELMGST